MLKPIFIAITLALSFLPLISHAQDADQVLDSARALLEKVGEAPSAKPQSVEASPAAPKPVKDIPIPPALVRLGFAPGETALLENHKEKLRKQLLWTMLGDQTIKLEIQSYASGNKVQESEARRISLSRALEIQSFLVASGVSERLIYPRALGTLSGGAPDEVILLLTH